MSERDLTKKYNAAVTAWNNAKSAVKAAELSLELAQLRERDTYRALDEATRDIDAWAGASKRNVARVVAKEQGE